LLVGFIDLDWVGDPNDRNSIVGYVFSLGYGPVTWDCKKQQDLTLSSTEAEYREEVNASQESLWLQQIFLEFRLQQQHSTNLQCDNQSAIKLAKYLVQHQRNKHIKIHMHFIRKIFMIKLLKCSFFLQNIKLQTFSQSLL
jgi:hypothetical protein